MPFNKLQPLRDESALAGAVADILVRVQKGQRTVIIPGHEVHREELQEKVLELVDKTGLPAASMFIGKAEFLEQHPPGSRPLGQAKQTARDLRIELEQYNTDPC